MQRQHNLLKAKFAKYQMMKPKFQSTKSLSDLLQRTRSRDTSERQSLPAANSSTRQIKSKQNLIMGGKEKQTSSSRNGEKPQLTGTLAKTRADSSLGHTKGG